MHAKGYSVWLCSADLKRLDSVELFERLRLFVRVTHRQNVGRHLRDDVPRITDVVIDGVLSADRESDDVVVIDERRHHVQLAGHVDSAQ